ncbi:hypothetical protein D3C71_2079430 [compost metagenome]
MSANVPVFLLTPFLLCILLVKVTSVFVLKLIQTAPSIASYYEWTAVWQILLRRVRNKRLK